MRVGVVDLGSNSTRLLVADVEGSAVLREVDRRTTVTRLGAGVDATGRLADEAMERVLLVLDEYAAALEATGCEVRTGVLTSAVRDAANGDVFAEQVRARAGVDARVLDGDEEARLTFLGATAGRDLAGAEPLLVVDIGGGSTELVLGDAGGVRAHVSLQLGVVRQSERHLHADPPGHDELVALADDVRAQLAAAREALGEVMPAAGIAVAGTPTSCAAIAQELEPYDPTQVEGFVLELGVLEEIEARLATLDLEHRRQVTGLHPDRAPTIVAGVVVLVETLRAFGLERVAASERDLLHGAALAAV